MPLPLTFQEACNRWTHFTPGERVEGQYTVTGRTLTMRQALAFPDTVESVQVNVIAADLVGWPGEDFVLATFADGQPAGCGFARRKAD